VQPTPQFLRADPIDPECDARCRERCVPEPLLGPDADVTRFKASDGLRVAVKRGEQVLACDIRRELCVACIDRAAAAGAIKPQN
jgi:hypothetical protein